MKFRIFLILILSLVFSGLKAQPAETTYLGTTIKEGSANNVAYGPFDIGFTFTFYGNTYTQFYVSSNGLVTFGSGSTVNAEATIPSTTLPDNFIAPFWDDLTIDALGNILYATIGAAPNRKTVIQFRNMGFYPAPVYMGTFSVILYETSNIIQTQYRQIVLQDVDQAKGGSAAIGIENSDGTSGIEYANHSAVAVNSWKAISYTPSGVTYDINPNAIYEGIYLTKNLTLPEPGIADLLSPSDGSTIGTDVTFEWGESIYATTYYLRMSPNANMSGASTYYSGPNLTATVSGLTAGTTYYWTVLTSNTTGSTWNEVKKFTVSSAPPLTAVPQTVWSEQSQDKTIKLNYTGGDASAKTAIITSIPVQGTLWQYNAGVKGTQITSVPATITDPNRNIIYSSPSASGNGIGNFKFKMHDDTGDSPEATITVNVSPPGIPSVLYIAKGNGVEIQFDRIMADPTGKQGQFTVTVNGSPATVSSAVLKTGDPYTISLALSPALTGTETVLVAYTQGDVTSAAGGYLLSFTDQPVTLRSQTINFTQSLTKKYNESPFNLTATSSSGLGLTYSSSNLTVATISSSTVTLKAIGNSDITARQAGNATWAPAKYVRTMTVAKGDQTITFGTLTAKTYGDADFTLTGVSSSALSVSYTSSNTSVATVTGNTVHIVGAGSTIITASQAGNTLWNAAPDVPQTLVVGKANQTITFGALTTKAYGDADFALTGVSSSTLIVSYISSDPAVATVTGNTVHITGAGTTTITASQAGDTNFNPATEVPQTLTVNKADQTITFGPLLDQTFGAPDYSLFGTASSGLVVSYVSSNPAVATVTGSTVHIVAVGTTTITASQPGDANYNAATVVPQTLDVYTANATITLGSLSATYNGAGHAATANTSPAGLAVDFTYDGSTTPPVNASSYTVNASVNDPGYHGTATGTLVISKADQTIAFPPITDHTYGNPDFNISAVASSGLSVSFGSNNNSVATITGNSVHIVGAGTTTMTASQAGDANWNPAPDVQQTLTINKADQTITFSPLTAKTFGDADFTLSGVSSSALSVSYLSNNMAVATITGNTAHVAGAGTTTITASQAGDANWNAAPDVTQSLTVNKADQTITFSPITAKTYGDADFTLSGVSSSALSVSYSSNNTAVATVTGNTVHIVGAGTTTITASQAGDENWNVAPDVQRTLLINKANQTITFSPITAKTYGDADFTLSGVSSSALSVSYSSNNTAVATVSGNTVHIAGAGTTTITASQAGDANWNAATDVTQSFTVNKADQVITITSSPEKLLVGSSESLTATSTAGLTVDFESLDTDLATINGSTVTGVAKGNVEVRAYNPGNQNHNPAEARITIEIYSTHKDILNLFTPNGDGFNDYWELPEMQTWGKCDVRVYNRWGKLVYANKNYDNLWNGTSDGKPLPEGAYIYIIETENDGVKKGSLNIVR